MDNSKGRTKSLFSFLVFTGTLSATSFSFFRFFFDGFSFAAVSDFSFLFSLFVEFVELSGLLSPDFSSRRNRLLTSDGKGTSTLTKKVKKNEEATVQQKQQQSYHQIILTAEI